MAIEDLKPEGFSDEHATYARWTLRPRATAQGMWGGTYALWLDIESAGRTLIGHGYPEDALREALAKLDELKAQVAMLTRSSRAITTAMLKDLEELWMRDNLIETLRDCANALGELLPRDHAYRKIVDQANRLLDRHDQASEEQRATDALRDLMSALPKSTQTSMTVFKPEVDGQKAGAVKAFLMAENADDLRCAQWVIAQGSAKRGEEQWPL